MRVILTVFKKEMVDTLRDRRAIVLMIVLPLLLFPTIFRVMVMVEKRQAAKAEAKPAAKKAPATPGAGRPTRRGPRQRSPPSAAVERSAAAPPSPA